MTRRLAGGKLDSKSLTAYATRQVYIRNRTNPRPVEIAAAVVAVGLQFCFLSEFWTKVSAPKEYGGLDGVGAFAEATRAHGFTDRELDLLFRENSAKALGLAPIP